MPLLPLKTRQAAFARLSYVTQLKKPRSCEGWTYRTPLKAIYIMGGKPPVGREPYACRRPAFWRFRALQQSGASSGTFCWQHLNAQVFDYDLERGRFDAAIKRLGLPE